jgi:hypothetical protein
MRTQITDIQNNNTKYTRVENHTIKKFTQNEIQLLNKGLKYDLCHKTKKWIDTLAFEAETAVSNLDIKNKISIIDT